MFCISVYHSQTISITLQIVLRAALTVPVTYQRGARGHLDPNDGYSSAVCAYNYRQLLSLFEGTSFRPLPHLIYVNGEDEHRNCLSDDRSANKPRDSQYVHQWRVSHDASP